MKIKQFLLALSFLPIVSQAQNSLTVSETTIPQNGGYLTFNFTFAEDNVYTAYGFEIETPEGITYITDEDDDVTECVLGNCHTSSHNPVVHWDDELRVLIVGVTSTSSKLLNGTSGMLISIPVGATEAAVGTEFTFTLKNIAYIRQEHAQKDYLEDKTFTITIGEPDTRVVFDETSTSLPTLPTPATNVDVRVKRTIKANEWSTICLPFAMSEGQVQAAFGGDVQLADFTGTDPVFDDKDVAGINVNFSSVVAIEANHPYIIKVSSPVTEFTADGVDIIADEENACVEFDNGKTGSRRVVYSGFYGTYHAETVLDEFTLFLNDNKFWYSAGGTRMKAFRAFFDFLDILTSVKEGGEAKIRFQFENSNATAIQTIAANAEDNVIYSINGVRMGTADKLKALPKGLYIVNGKKVIIK